MLVLTRNRSQQVLIGDDIVVTIVEARNGKVRIGIDAPQDVLILRPEVLAKKREHAKAIAASGSTEDQLRSTAGRTANDSPVDV